eukprot:COSAG06_NODE_19615_length_830_cov_3.406293_1_plen_87_part_00
MEQQGTFRGVFFDGRCSNSAAVSHRIELALWLVCAFSLDGLCPLPFNQSYHYKIRLYFKQELGLAAARCPPAAGGDGMGGTCAPPG